jgi:L-gulonolactone oxidase
MWHNWAGDQHCVPFAIERPASVAEVQDVVRRAAQSGRTVRAVGAGHSFTDAALTNGHVVSLQRLCRVLDVDRAGGVVRVQAGITIAQLSRELAAHGLALENLGDIDVQSIAGATATATHGTGARLGNIGSNLLAATVVDGAGEVAHLSEGDDLLAARASLGALGVICELTLAVVPAFRLHAVERLEPVDALLADLDATVEANEHFEFFFMPHVDVALTKRNNRTTAAPNAPTGARKWVQDILLGNHALDLVCRIGRAAPRQIPRLNRIASKTVGGVDVVDHSHLVFASPRIVRFTEMEYAVPREHAVTAIRAVREVVDSGRHDVNFPVEVRFVAADDALLSTAHGRPSAYIAVHMYRGMEWEPYFREVEAIMDGLDGRPHWGKRHFQTAATLAPRYPGWDRFQAVRERMDPGGRFANAYTDRVLGRAPVSAPTTAA